MSDHAESINCPKCNGSTHDWYSPQDEWHDCPNTGKRERYAVDMCKCIRCGHCFWVLRYDCGCNTEYEELDPKWDECPEDEGEA